MIRSVDKVQHEINKSFFFKDEYPIAMKIVRGAYLLEEREIEKRDKRIDVFLLFSMILICLFVNFEIYLTIKAI